MHVYLRLLQYFPYPVFFTDTIVPPPGFSRLITSRALVVTGRGNQVIVRNQ